MSLKPNLPGIPGKTPVRRSCRGMAPRSFRPLLPGSVYVMGILNVTPDSFSDAKSFFDHKRAAARALEMAREGADIIDVGGESTRPGASDVSVREELRRVIPVIKSIRSRIKIPVSIDTRKSEVAEAAIEAGASIINDVSGLRYDNRIACVAARTGAGLILMHMKGTPRNMQVRPVYKDLMREIIRSLKGSICAAKTAGVMEENIIIDPGIGFGKSCDHNLTIIHRLRKLSVLNRPICVGISRKSFIGKVLGVEDPCGRIMGTAAANAIAVANGVSILRVHDVKEAKETARIVLSIIKERKV